MGCMSVRAVPDAPEGQEGVPAVTLAAAVDEVIADISPPKSDAAVVALARKMAAAIDHMSDAQAAAMIGQTAPQFLKVLQELDARHEKRKARAGSGRQNRVAGLRAAHAQHPARRRRGA